MYEGEGNIREVVESVSKARGSLLEADLSRADLSRADLSRADLSRADLSRADLSGACLSKANLYGANLYRANLSKANLYGANLSKANLYGVNLSKANLYGANLSKACLYGVNLSKACLYGANLYRANLYGVNLSKADLYGACLSKADLAGCKNLSKIYRSDLSILEFQTGKLRAFKYLNGQVSPYQGSSYEVGNTYTADSVDDDIRVLCGRGLNVASLNWCLRETGCDLIKTYIEVEFDVEDLLPVPYNSDGKFRVRKFRVLRVLPREELEKHIGDYFSERKKTCSIDTL